MSDRILTLDQVVAEGLIPLSKHALYRAAAEGDGPFRKVRGRWMVVESDLLEWVREGDRGGRLRLQEPPGDLMSSVLRARAGRV